MTSMPTPFTAPDAPGGRDQGRTGTPARREQPDGQECPPYTMRQRRPEGTGEDPKHFETGQEIRWCPGCGDYAILAQVQEVLAGLGLARKDIVFVSGIGCSSQFPHYVNTYGFHSIHGRAPAIALGIKCANPDLSVWVVTGDGDGLSIGTHHLIHCLRRNVDLKILLVNNRIYGWTKGQYSPTSEFGKRTNSSPLGTIEQPLCPVQIALAAEATFVARTVASDPAHLAETLAAAARHRGASFVEILQNCHVFNDGAFDGLGRGSDDHRILLQHGQPLRFGVDGCKGIAEHNLAPEIVDLEADRGQERNLLVHDVKAPTRTLAAWLADLEPPDFPLALGVFRDVDRPTYDALLRSQIAAVIAQRGRGDLRRLLNGGTTWEVD